MDAKTGERLRKEHTKKYRTLNKKYGVKWTGREMPRNWTKESIKERIL